MAAADMPHIHANYMKAMGNPSYRYVKQAVDLLVCLITPQSVQEIFVSFNGGKDATIVLMLYYFALQQTPFADKPINCIYFQEPSPFEEVDSFMATMKALLGLTIHILPSKKYGFELKEFFKHHSVSYIIMGSRKADPYCSHLRELTASDTCKGYPAFMRVNPIISWEYNQVWQFLKGLNIPYCQLYDEGYTYLGNQDNTVKNKELYDPNTNRFLAASSAAGEAETKSRVGV